MSRELMIPLFIGLIVLQGCQTTSNSPTYSPPAQSDQFQRVIFGGLGIEFTDSISKLKSLGFKPNERPKKAYEVGEWKIPFNKASGFFNFGMEVVTSPISGRIFKIRGYRFYGGKRYLNHFSQCDEDLTLLRTQLEQKYPSLHKSYTSGLNKTGEHSSISFYEGKGSYSYGTTRHFGRYVNFSCSIQTSGDSVIGSMLFVNYGEDYKESEQLRAEQKAVFADESGSRLKRKGIDPSQL